MCSINRPVNQLRSREWREQKAIKAGDKNAEGVLNQVRQPLISLVRGGPLANGRVRPRLMLLLLTSLLLLR